MPRSPFSDEAKDLLDRIAEILNPENRAEMERLIVQIKLDWIQWAEAERKSPSTRGARDLLRGAHNDAEQLRIKLRRIDVRFIPVMGATATADALEMVRKYHVATANPEDALACVIREILPLLDRLAPLLGQRADQQRVSSGNVSAQKITAGTREQKLAIACCYLVDHYGIAVTNSPQSKLREVADLVYEFVTDEEPDQQMKKPLEFACPAYQKSKRSNTSTRYT
jgi:hypothetical protein